ncbi:MAG: hypothetical protein V4450_13890 [Bacteroidota bacterium]
MRKKNRSLSISLLACFVLSAINNYGQNSKNTVAENYQPRYWVEGTTSYTKNIDKATEESIGKMIDDVYAKGWRGVLYWGASRNGSKMNYYYKSPYLEKQPWAVFERDGLSPIVAAAKKKGIKVMVNMEGVNPYHWEKHQWNPATIASAANDLAATGIDAVFEECFEVRSDVFSSLAKTLKQNKVDYISGTDPMLLRESNFATLWPQTGTINVYNYYLKRDKIYNIATLAQHGSLGLGWAKYWNKPTSLISPVNRNWGIASEYTPAVIPYLCMLRALQFRMDNFIIFGGMDSFDPIQTQSWIKEYVDKQEKNRPVLNIVVLLNKGTDYSGSDGGDASWNRLFNSGDAITSGAFNGGYNIVVSDKVIPADAYWIYAPGGKNAILPKDVVALFDTDKKVFLQASSGFPNGPGIDPGWKAALDKCGIDAGKKFIYAGSSDSQSESSLPENQDEEIPYTGYYNNRYLRFTGSDVQRGKDLRAGTIIPKEAINGTVYSMPNKTYGKGPYIAGKNNKYAVTTTALNWEVAYPISHLLSGGGVAPSSNVWGIAGKNVTAFLAIETTELELVIPGLADGSTIHVVVWDNKKNKKTEETITYKAPYKHFLKEYDFIMIDTISK